MLLLRQSGENVSRPADELGIHRQRLCAWREQLRVCGNLTPSRPGRPKKRPPKAPPDRQALAAGFARSVGQRRADALTKARRRIVQLERKIGQQQVELDFFKKSCGMSGAVNGRKTHPAVQRLRSHSKNDSPCAASLANPGTMRRPSR
ncbi:hypothetical protein [Phyllobacterium sophorae]|uniref:hypothetical protein n=1 Tax=Phyllobacterium sophorae TaxID=1520277 RepID=UPI001FE003E7|nr:hypothetical protein [Phyllobacterium sophorae]